MVWSSLAPKLPILVIFCRMDHQKSNSLLIYGTSFYQRLLRPAYAIFLKTFWWNSNAQTSGIYRHLHCNLNVLFRWPPRSSKSVNMSWNTLYKHFLNLALGQFGPSGCLQEGVVRFQFICSLSTERNSLRMYNYSSFTLILVNSCYHLYEKNTYLGG